MPTLATEAASLSMISLTSGGGGRCCCAVAAGACGVTCVGSVDASVVAVAAAWDVAVGN